MIDENCEAILAWNWFLNWQKPSRNAQMSARLFKNKIFNIKTRTVKFGTAKSAIVRIYKNIRSHAERFNHLGVTILKRRLRKSLEYRIGHQTKLSIFNTLIVFMIAKVIAFHVPMTTKIGCALFPFRYGKNPSRKGIGNSISFKN